MIKPPIPHNERRRLEVLRSLNILDTDPEERFDRVTRLARRIFGTPIALVSLVDADRQWFKSKQGLDACQTGREISFCGHAILADEILVVPDALRDERFADNPLVTGEPHVRFYAGYPLTGPEGMKLGTLCVIDREPRRFGKEDLSMLIELGRMVEQEMQALSRSTTDPLTGLSNLLGFETLGKQALAVCIRASRPATLVYVDIDDFGDFNRQAGTGAGDARLVEMGHLLLANFRESDVVGRVGPDEFAVLVTNADAAAAQAALDRMQAQIAQNNRTSDGREPLLSVTAVAVDRVASGHASIDALLGAGAQRLHDRVAADRRIA